MVDLLMLHRKTKIDKLLSLVPVPANALPINALPGWEKLPLTHKLPMLHCPGNAIIFTRNRLGRKLDNSSAIKFRLSNSFTHPEYDLRHDPNLRACLHLEQNLHLLQVHGQITYNKDVICTLKEFNAYRQYLNQVRLELVNRERERLDAEAEERRLFNRVQEITEHNFQKKMHFMSQQVNYEEMLAEKHRKFIEEQERKDLMFMARMEQQAHLKAIKQEIRELQAIEFHGRLQRVHEGRRLWVSKLKRRLRLRDKRRISDMIKLRQRLAEEKAEADIQLWLTMRQKRIERQRHNENLLINYEVDMKHRIEMRIQRNEIIRERVQHKILQTKVNFIRSRYENMELNRLIQVVTEEIHRKVNREKNERLKLKLYINSERAGLSPIVAPYRTRAESEIGLGDAPSDYDAIDDLTIKQVVTTCSRNEKILNGKSYNTMEVLLAAKWIFDRIACGFTDDLPNDPDVLKFSLIVVDSVISRVKERVFKATLNMIQKQQGNDGNGENPPRTKSMSTLNRNATKSSKVSNNISFKDLECDPNKRSKLLVVEKMASLRTMVRSALETASLHDDLPIPLELDDDKLFHLSQQQKQLVVRNLHNLENMLGIRLEQNVIARFDLASLTVKPCNKKLHTCHEHNSEGSEISEELYNNLMGRAMTSVLTKPELDELYPTTILDLSDFLAGKVLYDLQLYINHGEEVEQEEGEYEYEIEMYGIEHGELLEMEVGGEIGEEH